MLFDPIKIRDLTVRNRIVMSPMCQYSAQDGFANDWHYLHYGARAVGGAGVIILEAACIEPRGRITPHDLGIWKDEHIEPLRRIVKLIESHGAVAGIQIAHAGRKASTSRPWDGGTPIAHSEGGWQPAGASPMAFDQGYPTPVELSTDDIDGLVDKFVQAAVRARQAGFKIIELHAAHGYLLHEFLSPLSNQRQDRYGGSFVNRTRFLISAACAVRKAWPQDLPMWVRISATDWMDPEGWTLDQSVQLARLLKDIQVDLIDCSSGGLVPNATIAVGPGFQTPFAEIIRREVGIRTGAVGLITSAIQAQHILQTQQADLVLVGRQLLRDPYWPVHAAAELRQKPAWPPQYHRAA